MTHCFENDKRFAEEMFSPERRGQMASSGKPQGSGNFPGFDADAW